MAKWYDTFDDQFWIMVAGMLLGFLGLLAKSKCTRCSCFGMEIERDVDAEVELARAEMRQQGRQNQSSNILSRGASAFTRMAPPSSPYGTRTRENSLETTNSPNQIGGYSPQEKRPTPLSIPKKEVEFNLSSSSSGPSEPLRSNSV